MRLGRLAAAGVIAGAVVAFAVALLRPRRRPSPSAGTDTPDLGSSAAPTTHQVDVAAAERATTIAARAET